MFYCLNLVIIAPLAKSVCSFESLVQTPNPFVIVLRNAQADFSIRIWTYLVPILKKQTSKKTNLVHFRSRFLPHKSWPNSSTNIFVNIIA